MVGWGVYDEMRVTGPDAAQRIETWFAETIAGLALAVDPQIQTDALARPICLVSLGFADTDESVAVIPRVVVRRGSTAAGVTATTVTTVGDSSPLLRGIDPASFGFPGQIWYSDSDSPTTGFMTMISTAVDRIRAGEAEKVVLSHSLTATTEFPVDERFLLHQLAGRYPSCATYAVDGLIGASPEILMRRTGDTISSRVLAGTAWPGWGNAATPAQAGMHRAAEGLLGSAKDLAEHEFAVRSVAEVLGPLADIVVPQHPSALELANLTHLATDITGSLRARGGRPSALVLAAALHPTAAVGGTPTDVARRMIAELEPAPRGRYAAPVGWIDTHGDGVFAIALRCARVAGDTVQMIAGCGIVADSDPAVEAQEAQVKMLPIRDALES